MPPLDGAQVLEAPVTPPPLPPRYVMAGVWGRPRPWRIRLGRVLYPLVHGAFELLIEGNALTEIEVKMDPTVFGWRLDYNDGTFKCAAN